MKLITVNTHDHHPKELEHYRHVPEGPTTCNSVTTPFLFGTNGWSTRVLSWANHF